MCFSLVQIYFVYSVLGRLVNTVCTKHCTSTLLTADNEFKYNPSHPNYLPSMNQLNLKLNNEVTALCEAQVEKIK